MGTDFAVYYAEILRRTAREWGVDVPLDGLLDDDDIPKPLVVEAIKWQDANHRHRKVEIEFVTFNNLWSYTINLLDDKYGYSYGPCLKFCPPYPTRVAALAAVIGALRNHNHQLSPEILAWLDSLERPRQLSLF